MRALDTVTLIGALCLATCSKSEPQPTAAPSALPTSPIAKDPEAARKLIDAGAIVIDVRTASEYADGHLDAATNIPVQEFAARIAEVDKLVARDKSRPIVVYCAKGGRAAKAKTQLDDAGYTHVVNGGGLDDLR
jgi:phage shock protein E